MNKTETTTTKPSTLLADAFDELIRSSLLVVRGEVDKQVSFALEDALVTEEQVVDLINDSQPDLEEFVTATYLEDEIKDTINEFVADKDVVFRNDFHELLESHHVIESIEELQQKSTLNNQDNTVLDKKRIKLEKQVEQNEDDIDDLKDLVGRLEHTVKLLAEQLQAESDKVSEYRTLISERVHNPDLDTDELATKIKNERQSEETESVPTPLATATEEEILKHLR